MRIPTVLSVVLAATLVGVTACGGGPGGGDADAPIVIGVVNPLSGPNAEPVSLINNAYQMAVDIKNEAGGIDGRQLKLVFGDAANADQATTTAQRLITSEGADILTGTFISAVSDTASQTAARYQIPYWETNGLANILTERGLPNFFRVGINASGYGRCFETGIPLMERVTGQSAASTSVVITHEQSIYGTSVAEAETAAFKAAGVTVKATIPYDPASTDLTAVVLQAKRQSPDVWTLNPYAPDAVLLFRTAQEQNWRPKMVWGVGLGIGSIAQGAGQDTVEGVFGCDYPRDLNPSFAPGSDTYLTEYAARFKVTPTLPQAQTAYAGMTVLLQVLDKTGGNTELEPFSEAAMGLDLPLGTLPTGSGVKFDDKHQNERVVSVIQQWQDGKFKTVWPEAAVPDGNKLAPGAP